MHFITLNFGTTNADMTSALLFTQNNNYIVKISNKLFIG